MTQPKFRGYCIEDGEWKYGDYITAEIGFQINHYIVDSCKGIHVDVNTNRKIVHEGEYMKQIPKLGAFG